jgi:hypothetical protein
MVKTETLHSNPCILHEDTFDEYFKPIRHPEARYDIWGGYGLETFGEDLELVRGYDPAFVWTVVEGDSGMDWITPGFRYVNRLCYLVTEKPHNFIPVEFRIRRSAHSLTPLGLKRQILKVKRLATECPLSA